ncbi:histidine phosphatase family protein [Mycolicibacterium komossense]|uniref:histidine phosphatase family protein n=1 Tax=Mycolicibacterium komossense TaxID=1779 RepID=UPI0021F2B6E1|nr:histidine phosphatase family protein [Mycolicibacterium komossense]
MRSTRLVLIRHGQTPANIAEQLDTVAPGAGLTELGHLQAAAMPSALIGQPIEAIYVSPLVRTHQTATPLARARGLVPRALDGLREVSAGERNGEHGTDLVRRYHRTIMSWTDGAQDRLFGGENGPEFLARYDGALLAICASGVSDAVVVSHGSAMRCWAAARAENITPAFARENVLSNTGTITVERTAQGGWRVLDWNCETLGLRHLSETALVPVAG